VLLYHIHNSKPIDGKELAFLLLRGKSVNCLAQLLIERVPELLDVLSIRAHIVLIELLVLLFRERPGFSEIRKERMLCEYVQLRLGAVSRVREMPCDGRSSLEEVLVEDVRELGEILLLIEGRKKASRAALGGIVLGSHRALLFCRRVLAFTFVEEAGEVRVRYVPQLGHVRRGADLDESAHCGRFGHKWFRLRNGSFRGFGHLGRVLLRRWYWTWFRFRLRNVRDLSRVALFLGFGAAKCEDALFFLNVFEGVFCFSFAVVTGFGSLFFNGFVGLNGDGDGFVGVLSLGGFGETARFFFWRTRVDDSLG
jgi:hypothetical protein